MPDVPVEDGDVRPRDEFWEAGTRDEEAGWAALLVGPSLVRLQGGTETELPSIHD